MVANTSMYQEGDTVNSTGTEAPVLGTLSDLVQYMSLSGCFSVSFITSFTKLVNVSKSFPEFWELL